MNNKELSDEIKTLEKIIQKQVEERRNRLNATESPSPPQVTSPTPTSTSPSTTNNRNSNI
jgi:hypothetical protein